MWGWWWLDIAEITGWDENQIRVYFNLQCEDLKIRTQNHREKSQKLQLGRARIDYITVVIWHEIHTRLLYMIATDQAPSHVEMVAEFIWSEYMAYQLYGEKIFETRDNIRGEIVGYVPPPIPLLRPSRTDTYDI